MKIYNNSAGEGPYDEEDTEALADAGRDRIYDCAPAVACARLEFSMKDGKEGALGLELKTEGESFYTELDFENATVLGFSYCLGDSVVVSAATAAPTVSAHPTFAPIVGGAGDVAEKLPQGIGSRPWSRIRASRPAAQTRVRVARAAPAWRWTGTPSSRS